MNSIKSTLCAGVGLVGSFIANLFGGWTNDMGTLVIFMAIDFVMGLVIAGVFQNSTKSNNGALDSKAGWKGLCRKCMTLLFVLVAHRLDLSIGTDYIRTTCIIAFIANETISIVENVGLMGIPVHPIIKKAIDILKSKEDDEK